MKRAADSGDEGGGAEENEQNKKAAVAQPDEQCLEAIKGVIREEKKHSGTSLRALQKHLDGRFDAETVKTTLKTGVSSGALLQRKASFLVKGEEYADTTPRVTIEVLAQGQDGEAPAKKGSTIAVDYKA
jgi:hypothetical protein